MLYYISFVLKQFYLPSLYDVFVVFSVYFLQNVDFVSRSQLRVSKYPGSTISSLYY